MMRNESDTKMTGLSYSTRGSNASMGSPKARVFRNMPLHEKCTMEDMLNMKDIFEASLNHKLSRYEFRNVMRDQLNLEYDDEDYNVLFMKINTNRDGSVDWDEFVSHLQLGYFGNDPENQRETLQPPIMGLPVVMRSQHRHPISRILFCPDVAKDRSTDPLQGTYITVSRDGMLNWWSLDMNLLRTAFSSNPTLKVRTTWVTDMICLPDVNIVVTSSTERDLRFYDCTARTFTLKIVISSWEFMICSMYYHFNKDINENCMIVLGDVGGHVRLLTFSPIGRGPFRNEAGRALILIRHKDFQRKPHLLPEMQLHEMGRAHNEWVRNVSYYASLHCVVSCATCFDALLLRDPRSSGTHNMFHVEKGVHCFAFDQEAHVLVTGGPDCTVRVWNPFVPSKPSVVFEGHHAGITCIVLQNHGQIIYTLARDRAIKVWDVQGQMCTQTYIDVPPQVGERSPISAVYNPATRDFILAAIRIAIITLDEQLNPAHTDGFTHSRAVSKVLYNSLFNVIITCGMDSIIMNWNPISGKRNVMIREAHTRLLHGAEIPVEITSGCFDPGQLLLLTGARDGSLKMWNFNTGVCLRYMSIQHMCEVTSCFWVEGRILAVGWNRHVTEFEDTGTSESGKAWELRHTDDVLCAAIRPPFTVSTATYNSEMIMWKLETGQPFRQFSCTDPTLRIKMTYTKRSHQPVSESSTVKQPSLLARASVCGRDNVNPNLAVKKARARRVSTVTLPAHVRSMRKLAVHCAIFLTTRPLHPKVASLMVGVENGQLQGWSDHVGGGYQGTFQGIHTAGDYVATLATDENNEFLFTGTTVGYIKVWLMTNYLTVDKVHVSMPKLRLQFPFLWRDRIEGRAKRCVRDQAQPRLLNSYRAHLRCITSLAYINDMRLLLSASSDYSVRLWRLDGTYVGTLGGVVPYDLNIPRDPPDVAKVASFTTLKVWHGGEVSRYVPGQVPVDKLRDITEYELSTCTYGSAPGEPLLGSHFRLPRRAEAQAPPVLDDALPTIPLYAHLRLASTQPARRPPTPELVRATRLKRTNVRKAHFDEAPPPPVVVVTPGAPPTSLQLEKPSQTQTQPAPAT